jgi:hypothetical protein
MARKPEDPAGPDGYPDGYLEDLVTPEHLLHLGMVRLDADKIGAAVARSAVAFLREPENLAALSGATLLPLIVFRGRRVPFLPLFIVSVMGEVGGRAAYRSYRNLETIASAAKSDA